MPLPAPPTRPRKKSSSVTQLRIQTIEDNIEKINKEVEECQDIQGKMDALDERTERMEKQVDKSTNAIYGEDGTLGIMTRLVTVENTTMDIKKALEKVLWAVIIGGGSLFIEQIVSLILQHR